MPIITPNIWRDSDTWQDGLIWQDYLEEIYSDYGDAMYRLLPTGEAWPPINEDSVLKRFLYGLGLSLDIFQSEAEEVLQRIFPGDTGIFLEDWETLCGLPKCPEIELTLQQRANAVLAMIGISPYSNAEFFEGIASVFGYEITVRSGNRNEFGNGDRDVFNLVITVVGEEPVYFRAGQSSAGDPLLVLDSDGIQCLLNFFKPAHIYLRFITS